MPNGGDVTVWIEWFTNVFAASCQASTALIAEALVRARFWAEHKHVALNARQRKVVNKVLEAGAGRFEGGLTQRKYVSMTGASPATSSRDITDLVSKGLLVPGGAAGRSTYYSLAIAGWGWHSGGSAEQGSHDDVDIEAHPWHGEADRGVHGKMASLRSATWRRCAIPRRDSRS